VSGTATGPHIDALRHRDRLGVALANGKSRASSGTPASLAAFPPGSLSRISPAPWWGCRNSGTGDVLATGIVPTSVPKTKIGGQEVSFPNETAEYRAAQDQLLEKEIGLRRAMVAAARRALPKGALAQDYVFDGLGADGNPVKVKLSERFAPGCDTLIVYSMMFARHKSDTPHSPNPAHLPTCRVRNALPVLYGVARST
jgi:hypothetical protein